MAQFVVVCQLCGFGYGQITGKHLKSAHGIDTVSDYLKMFPDASIYPSSVLESMGSWQTDDKDRSSKLSDALSGRVITWGDRISDAKFGQSSDRTSEEYSEVSREVWSRPGYREKLSSVHKKLWSDSDFKDHQVSLMKSGSGGLHPNYKESLLQSLLDVVEPKAWKFNTGDLVVSGLVPDYYRLDGIKSCVELFGDYWHKDEPEWFREGLYSRAGYKCLIVWERELGKDLDSFNRLVAKLQNFVDSNHGAPLE